MTARFRGDVDPYFAGCGDDPNASPGRGEGPLFLEGWDSAPGSPANKTFEFGFNDWIYIAGGDIYWTNGLPGDCVSFSMHCPASVVTPNGGGTGNCNIVSGVIVPAAGDGAYDLTTGNPLPAYDSDGQPNGYWDWSEPDEGKGTITPNPGSGNCNLIAAQYPLVNWVARLPLIGDGALVLTPETKARKVYPHWRFRLDLHNAGNSTVQLAWHLNTARKKTT
jgi:hypothetical protein